MVLWCYLDLMRPFFPDVLSKYSSLNHFFKIFQERDRISSYLQSDRRKKTFTVSIAPRGGTPETSSQP